MTPNEAAPPSARSASSADGSSRRSPWSHRVKRNLGQSGGLVESEHEVHALHGGAGGALDEVVDGAEGDGAVGAFLDLEADVGVVAAGHEFRVGEAVESR